MPPTTRAKGHAHCDGDLVDANLEPAARLGVEHDLLVLRAGPDDLRMATTRPSQLVPCSMSGPPASSSHRPHPASQHTSLRPERAGLLVAAEAAEAERIPCEQRDATVNCGFHHGEGLESEAKNPEREPPEHGLPQPAVSTLTEVSIGSTQQRNTAEVEITRSMQRGPGEDASRGRPSHTHPHTSSRVVQHQSLHACIASEWTQAL